MRFQHSTRTNDFSKFLVYDRETRKQTLIEECIARGFSIHRDDASESSLGVYSVFRAVASEAELEKRMLAQMGFNQTKRAFLVQVLNGLFAFLALLVAIGTLVKPFLMP